MTSAMRVKPTHLEGQKVFRFDNSYCHLPDALFAEVAPTPVVQPELLLFNQPLADELGLTDLSGRDAQTLLSGNRLPQGSRPIAQAYAGHQFGHPAMLGDGRAVLLGELLTPAGQRVDVQLKGAGRTPFSRGGDGRAALGPMLREYLVSESLHALGIPSSRALAVVTTGEPVQRETALPGAIVTRIARSHIRVGTFQYAAWHKDNRLLPALLDYALARHYPLLRDEVNPALAFLDAVMTTQISLIVHWMRVGFIHGVLNTDNVTITGEALDFGPCAFMDEYDPGTVFSSIDRQGRYAFNQQPVVTQWNLERLAEALLPLMDADAQVAIEQATQLLKTFMPRFGVQWRQMMQGKLGLQGEQAEDEQLMDDWLALLQQHRLDYTNAHRALMQPALPDDVVWQSPDIVQWWQRWRQRVDYAQARPLMQQHNPAIIPRNHRVEQALTAAQAGDMQPFEMLYQALRQPYAERASDDPLCQPPGASEKVNQTFCGT